MSKKLVARFPSALWLASTDSFSTGKDRVQPYERTSSDLSFRSMSIRKAHVSSVGANLVADFGMRSLAPNSIGVSRPAFGNRRRRRGNRADPFQSESAFRARSILHHYHHHHHPIPPSRRPESIGVVQLARASFPLRLLDAEEGQSPVWRCRLCASSAEAR